MYVSECLFFGKKRTLLQVLVFIRNCARFAVIWEQDYFSINKKALYRTTIAIYVWLMIYMTFQIFPKLRGSSEDFTENQVLQHFEA